MDFYDIVFPLNIGPLTYSWRRDRGHLCPGMLVRAQVKKSFQHGVVLRKATRPHGGNIKEISELLTDIQVAGPHLLQLLKWMAEYYICNEGLALKSMLPKDVLASLTLSQTRAPVKLETCRGAIGTLPFTLPPADEAVVSTVSRSVTDKKYNTYLLQTASFYDELSNLMEIVRELRNVIILVPEAAFIENIASFLREFAGERLTILHGGLTQAQRRHVFQRLVSGSSDVVLGTRLAIFAPLKSVSLIAVLQEHNTSYKSLEGVRYNSRDVAVMRAYIEKATALLSSPSPSIESFYNASSGKYSLLKPATRPPRPVIEIINMRFAKKTTPHLSKRVIDALSARMKRKEDGLLLVNRKGYSIIRCADCNFVESCPECGIPLVFHKDAGLLKCHYCNQTFGLSEACRKCKGTRLEMIGAGTQRVATEIHGILGIRPLVIDKDTFSKDVELNKPLNPPFPGGKHTGGLVSGKELIVGTKFVISRFPEIRSLDLCAFLNPDITLHLPDFRASEFLYHQISGISERIKPEGLLLLQTSIPENPVYRHVRTYDFEGFFKEELALRKTLSYPPFSRMILVSVPFGPKVEERLERVKSLNREGIEVMGPYKTAVKGKTAWKLLLKSLSRQKLHDYARSLSEEFTKEKGAKITIDVDPISI